MIIKEETNKQFIISSKDKKHEATVHYDNGVFSECGFSLGSQRYYSFNDWMFLEKLAKFIRLKGKELKKKG